MSNELKCTAGNWRAKETGGIREPFVIQCDGYTEIAALQWGTSPNVPETIEEVKANAHLIAASKDLYNALKDMYEFFSQYVPFVDHNGKSIREDWDESTVIKALNKANPGYLPDQDDDRVPDIEPLTILK